MHQFAVRLWTDQRGQNLLEFAAICSLIGAGVVSFLVTNTTVQVEASAAVKLIMATAMRLITA